MVRFLSVLISIFAAIPATAQDVFEIYVDVAEPKEKVWEVITDFPAYAKWNSMLTMRGNDSLRVEDKFHVTIVNSKGKESKFKATCMHKDNGNSFSARQKIMARWFFSATHHFMLQELPNGNTRFIQKWELTGIMSKLFRKMMHRELEHFKVMNEDLVKHLNAKV